MPSLKDSWRAFFKIVFDPFIIGLTILTFLFYLASTTITPSQTNEMVTVVLTLVSAVFSGFLGAAIEKRWTALTEERILVARGKVAIRSLTLLLSRIRSLELRVQEYLNRHNNEKWRENITVEVIKTYLEEVVQNCRILEDEALSSIDNWKDAIPEADVGIQVGVVSELNLELVRLAEEAKGLRSELEKTKERSEDETKQLKNRLDETVSQLSEARSRLARVDPLGVGASALRYGELQSVPQRVQMRSWDGELMMGRGWNPVYNPNEISWNPSYNPSGISWQETEADDKEKEGIEEE
jgi:hypothetical protein